MYPENFSDIIEKIKPHTNQIYLHVLGEPLLHPHLETLLNHCEEQEIKVNITTNGTLIKKASNILLECKVLNRVNFSLHSFKQQIDNKMVNEFDNYIKDISEFTLKALEKNTIAIYYRFWDQSINDLQKENEEMIKNLSEYLHLDIPKLNALKPTGATMIKRPLFVSKEVVFDWPKEDLLEREGKAYCLGIKEQIGILVDGTVVPCCLDCEGQLALGNINIESLQEILEGKRAKDIREGFSRGEAVERLCKKCTYRERFVRK